MIAGPIRRNRLRSGRAIAFLGCLCLVLSAPLAQAQGSTDGRTLDDAPGSSESKTVPIMNIWVNAAPLGAVIKQLAQLSGTEVDFEGALDSPVSGRFSGTLDDVLVALAADYPVRFDVSDGVLHATGSEVAKSVSIAFTKAPLEESLQREVLAYEKGGNDVELREDAVRVSGHPQFVERTATSITQLLAGSKRQDLPANLAASSGLAGSSELSGGSEPTSESNPSRNTEQSETTELSENAGRLPQSNALSGGAGSSDYAAGDSSELADIAAVAETGANTANVIDSGSPEMMADMKNEGSESEGQANLSKPVQWVTDIPGFDTF